MTTYEICITLRESSTEPNAIVIDTDLNGYGWWLDWMDQHGDDGTASPYVEQQVAGERLAAAIAGFSGRYTRVSQGQEQVISAEHAAMLIAAKRRYKIQPFEV